MSLIDLSPASTAGALRRWPALRLLEPLLTTGLLAMMTLALLVLGGSFADRSLRLIAGPGDERRLVNFHALEHNDTGPYRWSLPGAAVFLYGFDGRPAVVALTLAAARPAGEPPAIVRLGTAGRALAVVSPADAFRRYSLLAPTRADGDTALTIDSTPFEPGGDDTRLLGVALRAIRAEEARTGDLPPLQRGLWLFALPLLFYLLLWRAGVAPGQAMIAGGLAAGGVGLAAAYPAAAGYWLPTVLWPWWPLVPLGLLLGWPALRRGASRLTVWLGAHVPAPAWAGMAIGLAALAGIRLGLAPAAGLALVTGAVWLILSDRRLVIEGLERAGAAAGSAGRAVPLWPTPSLSPSLEGWLLGAIVVLALFLRLYQLDTLPAGLWRDEAKHGLLALRIWQDPAFRPVYVVEGADLPALLFYLMAPVVGTLGPHPWSVRLVSALAGGLTPLALWWAARPLVGPRAALAGAALIAWASWHLSMSRWAFPATLDHLLLLTAVGLMWRCLQEPRTESRESAPAPMVLGPWLSVLGMALAGLCAGLATYTYHTGRMAPLILAALAAMALGRSWRRWRRALPGLAVAALVGLLTMAPLLSFIAADTDGYNRRVARVSVFNSAETDIHAPLALLLRNVGRYLLMWHVSGEPNGRHHAPGAPMLDPVAGMLLLAGLALAWARRRNRAYAALLLWLGLGLVPGLFSAEAPHGMRSLGALAPACTLGGLTFASLTRRWVGHGGRVLLNRLSSPVSRLLPLGLLAASLAFNADLYFAQMASDPRVYAEFDTTATAMGRVARVLADTSDMMLRQVQLFLPDSARQEDTVRFLADGAPLNFFTGTSLTAPLGPEVLLLLPPDTSDAPHDVALYYLGPDAIALDAVPHNPDGTPLLLAYGIGDGAARLLQAVAWP